MFEVLEVPPGMNLPFDQGSVALSSSTLSLVEPPDSVQISAAARTICLSFADDPLIAWLRPDASKTWGAQELQVLKLQERRVQLCRLQRIILQSPSVDEIKKTSHPSQKAQEPCQYPTSGSDTGAIAILHPPKGRTPLTLSKVWGLIKLGLVQLFDEAKDVALDDRRMKIFYKAHDQCLSKLRRQLNGKLWYLEIIGVHPSMQGKGVGRAVMETVLTYANGQPIVLECTQEANVQFYRRFGFEVYEETELVDLSLTAATAAGGRVKLWVMICNQGRDESSRLDL
ncbi:uncharacterized protein N7496_007568 [Penicillium cataractarum]|uniref:N-acetyltransferase domain-containing protein n=1 Tax=Penicillium cataractarum TaxID=2100454 RepID=A0A9W9S3S8_9EURO|nr:uncharacterized protein N7496_007568 [Penicillium cataractarum]KAJ5371476.1 hypothetical protein N7496_007568 [Penicillium cataractarum]